MLGLTKNKASFCYTVLSLEALIHAILSFGNLIVYNLSSIALPIKHPIKLFLWQFFFYYNTVIIVLLNYFHLFFFRFLYLIFHSYPVLLICYCEHSVQKSLQAILRGSCDSVGRHRHLGILRTNTSYTIELNIYVNRSLFIGHFICKCMPFKTVSYYILLTSFYSTFLKFVYNFAFHKLLYMFQMKKSQKSDYAYVLYMFM